MRKLFRRFISTEAGILLPKLLFGYYIICWIGAISFILLLLVMTLL